MANLSELPQWESGIYQLETTDPVVGGPNGTSNAQAKLLANRTAYLKTQIDYLLNQYSTPTVNGNGEAINADLLDGLNSTQFLRSDTSGTLAGTLSVTGRVLASQGTGSTGGYSFTGEGAFDSGMFSPADGVLDLYANAQKQVSITSDVNILAPLRVTGNVVNNITLNNGAADSPGIHFQNPVDNTYVVSDLVGENYRAYGSYNGGAAFNVFSYDLSTKTYKVFDNTVWHAGNDGAGSGMDADLLDGLNSTQFLRSDINGTLAGTLSVTGQVLASQSAGSTGGYAFTNDSDTGMFSPADGVLDLYANAQKQVSITNEVSILAPLRVTGHTVWHDGLGAKSLATNGYQKLPSGLIIQWGLISHVVGTNNGDTASTTFAFPVAFPNKALSVTVANSCESGGDEFLECFTGFVDTSLTSVTISSKRLSGSNINTPLFVSIHAIGY